MKRKLLLPLCFLAATTTVFCQSLNITIPQHIDTTGITPTEWRSVEKTVSFTLPYTGSATDTLVVEMGAAPGSYDLFTREFPLSSTGTFNDGASLQTDNGLTVGLGSFTGLSDFYVRAYLRSAGVGSATVLTAYLARDTTVTELNFRDVWLKTCLLRNPFGPTCKRRSISSKRRA